ncbi:MAG: hypothetical protein Q9159_000109 [Coniocarpon cinnabarinum]
MTVGIQNRGDFELEQTLRGALTLMILAAFFVGVKLISPRMNGTPGQTFGLNEGIIGLALIAFILLCSFVIGYAKSYMAALNARSGKSQAESLLTMYKSSYAISILYPISSTLPKISLCMLYLQVFDIIIWARRVTFGIMVFLVANAIAWLVPTILVCQPISSYWTDHGPPWKCIDYNVVGTWISFPNIISDIVILVLPMPILWHMHLRRTKKIGLAITFATGSAGAVGACMRLGFYIQRTYVERPGAQQTTSELHVLFPIRLLFFLFEKLETLTRFAGSIALDMIVTYLEVMDEVSAMVRTVDSFSAREGL